MKSHYFGFRILNSSVHLLFLLPQVLARPSLSLVHKSDTSTRGRAFSFYSLSPRVIVTQLKMQFNAKLSGGCKCRGGGVRNRCFKKSQRKTLPLRMISTHRAFSALFFRGNWRIIRASSLSYSTFFFSVSSTSESKRDLFIASDFYPISTSSIFFSGIM